MHHLPVQVHHKMHMVGQDAHGRAKADMQTTGSKGAVKDALHDAAVEMRTFEQQQRPRAVAHRLKDVLPWVLDLLAPQRDLDAAVAVVADREGALRGVGAIAPLDRHRVLAGLHPWPRCDLCSIMRERQDKRGGEELVCMTCAHGIQCVHNHCFRTVSSCT